MLGRLTILIIILKSALCCKDTQFIIDYATLYSYSEITIVTNMHEIVATTPHFLLNLCLFLFFRLPLFVR